jgi:quinol-cytochrome oxidoreductase complex cytochrome b subunit
MWKNFIFAFFDSHFINYPTPANLNYAWSFGSTAGICLIIQILSGIFLAMNYVPKIDLAANSIASIMYDVDNGKFIRYMHVNGASFFFISVYCHIFRGIYYGSYLYPRQYLWWSGVILYILMMTTAFIGYVLPWGQMSYWGATVIINMLTILPFIGDEIVIWIWGNYTVNNATLNRFYSFHFVLPFIIVGVTLIHLALLHKVGSSNPLGVMHKPKKISFYPYFFLKDLFAFSIFILIFTYLLFYKPEMLGHPLNYEPADPYKTPRHIVPEWYFLPFYTVLRTVPHKAGGILIMFGLIFLWFLLPFISKSNIRSSVFRPFLKILFWLILFNFFFLGWIAPRNYKNDVIVNYAKSGLITYFLIYILGPILIYKFETYFLKKLLES